MALSELLLEWAEVFSLKSVGVGAGFTSCSFCAVGSVTPFLHAQQRFVGIYISE